MVAPYFIGITAILIVAVAALLISLRGRGKLLKCPDCGMVFAAPAFDDKISGLGKTFAGTGRLKCPKCGISRSRRDYLKADAAPT